jgi:heptosyltransferase-2
VKALVIAPAWVGDMVMAHTLVQRLSVLQPGVELHVAAPRATATLAARMAEVSQVHTLDFDHGELGLVKRRALGHSLRSYGYAVAYVLPNSWKSALVPFFAGISRRVGWQGEARYVLLNDRRKLDQARYPLMIERCMALAEINGALPDKPYPRPVLQTDADNLARCLSTLGLTPERATVMCPGAEFGAAKKWPAEHYAEVARAVMSAGRQVWLMGSPKEIEDCAAIEEAAPGVQNLAGRTTLLDALDLMSVAEQVVCNDSGLMHMACALNKPTVGIFGSTSPEFTPPLCDSAVVVEHTLACRPCFQRTCPLGHMDCLVKLMPQQVIGQLGL